MSLSFLVETRALLAVPISIGLAMLVEVMWRSIVQIIVQRTRSSLDDQISVLLRRPVEISLVLAGLGYALAAVPVNDSTRFVLNGILLSVATIVWTIAAVQSANVTLRYLNTHQERWNFVQPRTLPIFSLTARIILVGGGVYFLLLSWKIDVTAWLASAGIVGIAVAYAAKDTIANLLSGVTILTDAPYQLNDYLILDEKLQGRVTQIGFRSTRILTLDNVEVTIPNSIMANSTITNMSGGPRVHARLDVPVGVAYGTDTARLRPLLLQIADDLDRVVHDDPDLQPSVHFSEMADSALIFTLRVWLKDPADHLCVRDQANEKIYVALNETGIEIPYPKRDVYLHPS
ncbi:MAG: mechanosensitive ion channel family protein [Myxococcota bacterium]